MQLKRLEIHGFKSFADKQVFAFDGAITGIVGPNGCGKSNVVDAIRWVLGEQRTRQLRSDKMENVIFNGTKSRRKSNFAEVSLTFENTKNILPTEFTTVTVSRRLFRSGESEYLLNDVQCRLKDISDLFLDTGVGADSYAIIELGMVDEILTNKDNERRRFFEEAAGISKYKLRKKQTLRRLEEADADLARVEDLLFEIEKNLKSLEKQARRTQQYVEIKAQYRQVSARYAWLKLQELRDQRAQFERDERFLSDQLQALQGESALREARVQQLKKEQIDAEKQLSEAQAALNRHVARIQSVETEKSVKNERLRYLQQRELAIMNQSDAERERRQRAMQESETFQRQRDNLSGQLAAFIQEEQGLKAALDEIRRQHDARQQENEEATSIQREAEQEAQQLRQRIEIHAVQIRSLESELQRTEEDREARMQDMDAFGDRAGELEAVITKLEAETRELRQQKEQHEAALTTTEDEMNRLKDSVYRQNRLLDAKQNEHGLTRSLVENLEGFPESVKFLKKNAQWMKDAPLLSDVFACPDAYKVAFENYLEPFLSYYIVRSREDAVLAVHLLANSSKGRSNFFILDELEQFKPATPLLFTQAQPAMEVADFAPEYRKLAAFLFSDVYLVPGEQDIPEDAPEHVTFLTYAGNFSRRRYMLGGGSLGLFQGKRLGRAKNLEALEKEIKNLGKELAAEKLALEQCQQRLAQLRQLKPGRELEQLERQLLERQRDLQVLKSREKEVREFMERVGRRSSELLQAVSGLRESIDKDQPRLRLLQEELLQYNSRLAAARAAAQQSAGSLSEYSRNYNEAHIRLIQSQNQDNMLARDISQKIEQAQRLEELLTKLREEHNQVRLDIEQVIASNMQDDSVVVALYEEKKRLESGVEALEQEVARIKNGIWQGDEALGQQRKKREELQEQLQRLRDNDAELRVRNGALVERMSVEFQLNVEEIDPDTLFDKAPEAYVLDELEEEVQRLRARVQNFGEINPMAVEAYTEMQQRFEFISSQRKDLLDAKQSLLDTIREIDETAQAKFLETFELVRGHFKQVFRSLFTEDDACDLELKEPANPLESDISITARPKGKRPLTIAQLSGGEKTLTAIALLFSLYLIKPAPFCIFDEVDAPLDDANIDKFNNIIRDFSVSSQFVIVTHNKRTMASTNIIYGVTMEDAGVSRVVPVDLDTIYKIGENTQVA